MTTIRTTSPFRFDIVGSFLRPERLKQARADFENGTITQEELRHVEDEAIIELINKQEKAGLKSVTDGEFRRSWWHLDFFWGLNGIIRRKPAHGYHFNGIETRADTVQITGPISGTHHPFVEYFKFTQKHTSQGVQVKQTIPAPAQFLKELYREDNLLDVRNYYATEEELIQAIAKAYREVLLELYQAGARVIQLDDCSWGMLVGKLPEGFQKTGQDPQVVKEQLKELYLNVNNAALVDLPKDLTINTHVCRGNYHSHWSASGGYDDVAEPLFTSENVTAYYLEYDTDRSGGFEPLAKVSEDKLVVLGLITTKTGELEDRQRIIDRIHEASRYVPLDRLALSPQCGFASTEEGNVLSEEEQWEKIDLVKSIAEEVWEGEK